MRDRTIWNICDRCGSAKLFVADDDICPACGNVGGESQYYCCRCNHGYSEGRYCPWCGERRRPTHPADQSEYYAIKSIPEVFRYAFSFLFIFVLYFSIGVPLGPFGPSLWNGLLQLLVCIVICVIVYYITLATVEFITKFTGLPEKIRGDPLRNIMVCAGATLLLFLIITIFRAGLPSGLQRALDPVYDPAYAHGYNDGAIDGYNYGAIEGARCGAEWTIEQIEIDNGIIFARDYALEIPEREAVREYSFNTYPVTENEINYKEYGPFTGW